MKPDILGTCIPWQMEGVCPSKESPEGPKLINRLYIT